MVFDGVVPPEFKRHVPCEVELCVVSVGVPVSVYGFLCLIAYYSSYVCLSRTVMWIVRLVSAGACILLVPSNCITQTILRMGLWSP